MGAYISSARSSSPLMLEIDVPNPPSTKPSIRDPAPSRIPSGLQTESKASDVVQDMRMSWDARAAAVRIRTRKKENPNAFATLDREIWDYSTRNKQAAGILEKKQKVVDELLCVAYQAFGGRYVNLYVTGSSANGCGTNGSSLDLCLHVPDYGCSEDSGEKFALAMLKKLLHKLEENESKRGKERSFFGAELIREEAPLIRLRTRSFEIEIFCNRLAAIRSTHLINHYSLLDERFPALCLFIDKWAVEADIMNPDILGSYALSLMVIHYLQCGVDPPVFPNLQLAQSDWFTVSELNSLKRAHHLHHFWPGYKPANIQSVSELIVGFFEYFASFELLTSGISIATGRVCKRPPNLQFHFFIEEPFDAPRAVPCANEVMDLARVIEAFSKQADQYTVATHIFPVKPEMAAPATSVSRPQTQSPPQDTKKQPAALQQPPMHKLQPPTAVVKPQQPSKPTMIKKSASEVKQPCLQTASMKMPATSKQKATGWFGYPRLSFIIAFVAISTSIVSYTFSDPLPHHFYGKFAFHHSENVDEYLAARGYRWLSRKLVINLVSFELEFKRTPEWGRQFDFAHRTTMGRVAYRGISLGQEIIGAGLESSTRRKITFELTDGVLHERHEPVDGTSNGDEYAYGFEGDLLVVRMKQGDVVARRFYKRI